MIKNQRGSTLLESVIVVALMLSLAMGLLNTLWRSFINSQLAISTAHLARHRLTEINEEAHYASARKEKIIVTLAR